KQDVGAVGDVFRTREFAGGVADTGDAGNEDHADRTEARHVLGVGTRTGGQQPGCEAEFVSNIGDYRSNLWIRRRWDVDIDLLEIEFGFAVVANLLRFGLNLFEEHIDLRGVEVAQFQTQNYLSGDDVRRA